MATKVRADEAPVVALVIVALYAGGYALGRLWVESLRADPASLVLGVRVNILVSAIALAIAAAVVVVRERSRQPVPTG